MSSLLPPEVGGQKIATDTWQLVTKVDTLDIFPHPSTSKDHNELVLHMKTNFEKLQKSQIYTLSDVYGGPGSSRHCDYRKHKQVKKTLLPK